MKNFHRKTGALLLMFCMATVMMSQKASYKTLTLELQSLQKQMVPDKRVAILDIEIKDTLQPIVVVRGQTDMPAAKAKVIQFLNNAKVPFVDSIKVLPTALLGDKIWALATLSVANLRSQPDDAAELVSQALMGTPLRVLDAKGSWLRVQTPDMYIGWMDAAGLVRLTAAELDSWKASKRFLFNAVAGNASDAPRKRANVVSDLVWGDLFSVETTTRRYLKIKTPDGRVGYVRKKQCLSFDEWSNSPADAQTIIATARQMMGSPYLWGGTSCKAADCSGFVKQTFYALGIILARDASQQARYGQVIDITNINNLQPADLLFFGRSPQRITHVGIYIGNGDFIHSSGRVHISSINPADPKYVPTRINVKACRVLNSINTEGITRVKNHPWYAVQPK
jgi:cell wall-associated NlpC family hydrolase